MIDKKGILKLFDFCKGRKVMLHANYEVFGQVDGGPETVVHAFAELTELILFPTFNFHSWTEEHYWDQAETPSERGIISEAARRMMPRTNHPIYSFAVHSDDQKLQDRYLTARNTEAVDTMGSPFARFYEDGGMIVSVGYERLNDISASVQFAELKAKVDYRRIKEFHGIYKMLLQRPAIRTFSMFVRKPGVITAIDELIETLVDNKIITKTIRQIDTYLYRTPVPQAVIYTMHMKNFCDQMEWFAKHNPEYLHDQMVELKFRGGSDDG